MRFLVGLISVVALAAGGCSTAGADGKCRAPLSDYCSGSQCPTFEEAAASSGETGSCEDLDYVQSWGWSPQVLFFDESGRLVAAQICQDVPTYCNGTSWTIYYGPVPSFAEDLCASCQ